ncbi:MAG: hypothetical protein ACOYNY_34735 [Caldilineaceae bacterium]|jgi:hypothetical protein
MHSAQAVDKAKWQQWTAVTTTRVEVTGRIQEGRIILDTPPNGPILVSENELIIGGLHLVINLREEQATLP